MSNRQTTEQKRAASAWECVEDVAKKPKIQSEYGSWSRKLPAMIQMNGLGQTLAFLRAKGKNNPQKAQTILYNHIATWVGKRMGSGKQDFLQWIMNHNSGTYRRASAEATAYSIWLRRFAEAKDWGSAEGSDD